MEQKGQSPVAAGTLPAPTTVPGGSRVMQQFGAAQSPL